MPQTLGVVRRCLGESRLGENRSCAWWFFGAMLLAPAIDQLFTLYGYSLVGMFTGPWSGVNGPALHFVAPTALALGLAIVLALSWFVVARRGAPRQLWLVPLAFSLLRIADLAVSWGVRWNMSRGSDFVRAASGFSRNSPHGPTRRSSSTWAH